MISPLYRPLLLLLLAIAAPAFLPAQTTRPVTTIRWTELHDAARNRTLPIAISYPQDEQQHPLIIFSHGAYSTAAMYLPLAEYWAAHGYICILPIHADSIVFIKRDASNDPWSGPQDYGIYGTPATQGTWKPIWSERPRDLLFLLRSLDTIEATAPAIRGRLDRSHIGLAGHSLGAFSAMLAAGTIVDITGVGPNQSFADAKLHISALLLISPQGRGQQGLRDGSWDNLQLPMLIITGQYDFGVRDEPPTWREDPYRLSPPGDKYLLFVRGANHNSYFGRHIEEKGSALPLQRKDETDQALGQAILHETQATTLAFWNAYLKQDVAAKRSLSLRTSQHR